MRWFVSDRHVVDGDTVSGLITQDYAPISEVLVAVMPKGAPTSCTSAERWLGTDAAACATAGFAVSPTGLTGRSRECAAICNAQEVRDSPDASDLHDVDGATVEEMGELLESREVLARFATAALIAELSRACPLASHRRNGSIMREVALLFDCGDVANGLLEVPRLVGVQHHGGARGIRRERISDYPEPPDVVIEVPPTFEFSACETPISHTSVRLRESLVIERDIETDAYPVTNRSRAPSSRHKLAPTRHLRFQVPDRHVHGADAAESRTGMSWFLKTCASIRS